MSEHPTVSPRQQAYEPTDERDMKSGPCRYILLNPEIHGQRCACVGFSLNRSLPGVSCECGHLSCYHLKSVEQPLPPTEKTELDMLRERVSKIERQFTQGTPQGSQDTRVGFSPEMRQLNMRLGALEEEFENNKEDVSQETKSCYQNITRMWQSVEAIAHRQAATDERIFMFDERLDDQTNTVQKFDDDLKDLSDATKMLEERVDDLEDLERPQMSVDHKEPAFPPEHDQFAGWRTCSSRHRSHDSSTSTPVRTPSPNTSSLFQPLGGVIRPPPHPLNHQWTVHISLLPTASQPFPFEKDTNAYKRCLSRGLHHTTVIDGTDSASFVRAVNKKFGQLLRGRAWAPLQARLCDAETLEGLPMLRPLHESLVGLDNYTLDFLCRHCAVCHPSGKIDSLYIAMTEESFSWNFLRHSKCQMEGLEASWAYDHVLDRNEDWGDDKTAPSAGDIMTSLPTLKRPASDMSLGGGQEAINSPAIPFNENEGNGSRAAKVQRTACISNPHMELQRQGVETV